MFFMQNAVYNSGLSPYMESLVKFKAAQDKNTERYIATLRMFDDYCVRHNIHNVSDLTKEIIMGWRNEMLDNKENTKYAKYQIVNQLLQHINDLGIPCEKIRLPKNGTDSYIPYIFTKEEINLLFTEADKLRLAQNDVRSNMFYFPAIIRLLYATGIRVGEAVSIRNGDVNFCRGTIVLTHTKNNQDRLISVSKSAVLLLRQFAKHRQRLGIHNTERPDSYFFVTALGKPANKKIIYNWFRILLDKCNIIHMGRRYGPRIHDLRHTFAVHTLMNQIDKGIDIYSSLPWLSTYLGHKSPNATEHYVRLTRDAMPSAVDLQTRIAEDIYPQIEI